MKKFIFILLFLNSFLFAQKQYYITLSDEIKYKKDRRGKKGLTKWHKSDKINKSPRERAIKEEAKRR
jgi:hypothetical protein